MFHFGTNHTTITAGRLRVVPLFSLARRRRGEDGNGNWRRRGEDFERMEEDGEDGNGTLREGRKRDLEKDENGTLRRRKKGIGNHVIIKRFFGKMRFRLTTLTTLTTFSTKGSEDEKVNGGVIFTKNGTTTHNNSQHFLVPWGNVVRCCERVGSML